VERESCEDGERREECEAGGRVWRDVRQEEGGGMEDVRLWEEGRGMEGCEAVGGGRGYGGM